MTLLELLVAISIFSVLGGTLVLLLNRSVVAWRAGEARREAYEEAQTVIRQLRQDLRAAFAANPDVRDRAAPAQLACWFVEGRQRLALVRTIPSELRHPIAGLAGSQLGGAAYMDGYGDWQEGREGELRASGGLTEVLYALDPDADVLYRAVRSPIGGEGSLFDLDALADPIALRAAARPLSSRVLHVGFRFWTQRTESWEGPTPEPGSSGGAEPLGPLLVWDSSRGHLDQDMDLQSDERWLSRGSARDPDDDLIPERVLVVLVVAESHPAGPFSILTQALGRDGKEIRVENGQKLRQRLPWLRVGREWIRAAAGPSDDVFLVEPGGRGGRGTLAADHPANTDVVTGRTFVFEVDLPAAREAYR